MTGNFEEKMAQVGDKALDLISQYFDGESVDDDPKVERAFKFIGHPIKVLHMRQVRNIQERSQAIRLLKFLPDDESRERYIKATHPQAAAMLEHKSK